MYKNVMSAIKLSIKSCFGTNLSCGPVLEGASRSVCMRGRMYHHSQTHLQSSHDKFQTDSKLRIGNQSSALCPGAPFTPPDHGKEGRRERIGLRVRTERKVWFTCRDARSVRPACTTLISNQDVSSATRAVCPYIGMQHGGDYCSLMPRTGRPESLGDEPTWITWFVVNDQKT